MTHKTKRSKVLEDPIFQRIAQCPECLEPSAIIPNFNEFDYAGTHCTHGLSGIHYPLDWGHPITECCERSVGWVDVIHPEDLIGDTLHGCKVT